MCAGSSESASRGFVGQLKETITNLGLFGHQNASSNIMIEDTLLYTLYIKQVLL